MTSIRRWLLVSMLTLSMAGWSQSNSPAPQKSTPVAPQSAAPPGTPSPQLQPRPAEPGKLPPGGSARRIILDVQATDKSGAAIRGLQKEDFSLFDDKQAQPIVSFQAVDSAATAEPLEVVLVIDAVNASFDTVSYARSQIRKFLLQNNGELPQPVALVVFTDDGTKVQQAASRDGKALAEAYDQIETGLRTSTRAQGFYGASDRFQMSLKAIHDLTAYEASRPGRRLMVWISPGWPLLTGPNIELTDKEEHQIFNSIVGFSTELREARVTLYAIDPLGLADAGGTRITYYQEFLKGVSVPSRAEPANVSLQVLATQSGGRVLNSTNDLTASIATCVADAAYYYVLSFNAPRADHADEYHSLEVKVDKPKVEARTRTGYYAQP